MVNVYGFAVWASTYRFVSWNDKCLKNWVETIQLHQNGGKIKWEMFWFFFSEDASNLPAQGSFYSEKI